MRPEDQLCEYLPVENEFTLFDICQDLKRYEDTKDLIQVKGNCTLDQILELSKDKKNKDQQIFAWLDLAFKTPSQTVYHLVTTDRGGCFWREPLNMTLAQEYFERNRR